MKRLIPCMVTLAFVVLKLTGYVSWSWFWVLSPLWITIMIWIILTIMGLFIIMKVEKFEKQRREMKALHEQQERLQQERKAKS